jgi:DNA-binding PadR family transcriptional regulator
LERDGAVASAWDTGAARKRRVYTLTPAGEAALAAKRTHFDAFVAGVRSVLQHRAVMVP